MRAFMGLRLGKAYIAAAKTYLVGWFPERFALER